VKQRKAGLIRLEAAIKLCIEETEDKVAGIKASENLSSSNEIDTNNPITQND
jgi:hypothetical protein